MAIATLRAAAAAFVGNVACTSSEMAPRPVLLLCSTRNCRRAGNVSPANCGLIYRMPGVCGKVMSRTRRTLTAAGAARKAAEAAVMSDAIEAPCCSPVKSVMLTPSKAIATSIIGRGEGEGEFKSGGRKVDVDVLEGVAVVEEVAVAVAEGVLEVVDVEEGAEEEVLRAVVVEEADAVAVTVPKADAVQDTVGVADAVPELEDVPDAVKVADAVAVAEPIVTVLDEELVDVLEAVAVAEDDAVATAVDELDDEEVEALEAVAVADDDAVATAVDELDDEDVEVLVADSVEELVDVAVAVGVCVGVALGNAADALKRRPTSAGESARA